MYRSLLRSVKSPQFVYFAFGFIVALTISKVSVLLEPGRLSKNKYLQCVCFGDSITQEASSPERDGWVSALSAYWIRRVEVRNRGFSGYNTRWALKIYEKVVLGEKPDVIVIFFGANDSIDESVAQHVPLDEYKDNLKKMVLMTKKSLDSTKVILMTPPPVYEPVLEERNQAKGKTLLVDRSNERTLLYVNAVKDIGKEFGLPVVDNFNTMEVDSPNRNNYLRDGLHLSQLGNQRVFENIETVITKQLPQLIPDHLKLYQPHWSEIVENPSILS